MSADLVDVLRAFRVPGTLAEAVPWGSGHIHRSLRVTTTTEGGPWHALLQRVNTEVFPDPVQVGATIRRVTAHLRAKLQGRGVTDVDRRVLTPLDTAEGATTYRHEDGSWWRAAAFIDRARTVDTISSPTLARNAAFAFGTFQRDLADLPPPRLPETIPHFHDTPRRFAALQKAVAADAVGRVADAAAEIDFALSLEGMARVLLDAHAAGDVPERITHNDTKINNVLFDDATNEAICVIDLDTVMPGLGLHDFGDLVRTSSSPTAEDECDLARIGARPELLAALTDGYLAAMGDLLTPVERELLPFSGRLVTWMLGLRFLTDHLEGDTYFGAHRPDHNLDRARAQFALVRSLEDL